MILERLIFFKVFIFTVLILYVLSVFPVSALSKPKGVKTSYKRYSIFKYKNEDILCEPYIVKKGDWLYKIFKKKGELSIKNFPLFLIIFKEINPQINNIDMIKPGRQILIPLKKAGAKDYEQTTPGNIDVPIIEFSILPGELTLAPFIKKHNIQKGETVSGLISKDFLNQWGGISKEGLKAFQLVNPNIKNIHKIYEGTDIYLPDPSIKSQSWFMRLVPGKRGAFKKDETRKSFRLEKAKIAALKRYTSLIEGTLINSGKMYFPNKNNSGGFLDLSSTPIIDTKDGSKILILSGHNVSDALLKNIKNHWTDLKIQLISQIMDKAENARKNKLIKKNHGFIDHKKMIETLLSQTNYTYHPNTTIPFMMNNIPLEAQLGRVTKKDTREVLINFGIVYGAALDILKKQKFKVISMSPELTPLELAEKLFSNLGYKTWKNPSFSGKKEIHRINGLYAIKGKEKLFLPTGKLNLDAFTYLKKTRVKILSFE